MSELQKRRFKPGGKSFKPGIVRIPHNLILYIEDKNDGEVNQIVKDNYVSINNEFIKNKKKILFYPRAIVEHLDFFAKSYSESLKYSNPHFSEIEIQQSVSSFLDLFQAFLEEGIDISAAFRTLFSVPELEHSCFLVQTLYGFSPYIYNKSTQSPLGWAYRIAGQPVESSISEDIADFIGDIPPYNADDDFQNVQISWEIQQRIKLLKQADAYNELFDIMVILAKECGINEKEIQKTLFSRSHLLLADNLKVSTIDQKTILSSLVVDDEYRIFLPEFNNLEIKIPTLSKAVYFLFLKYPEGILFKYLTDYREELSSIYNRISNRTESEILEQSIESLLDITNNSINEKCSRIKGAFVSVMDSSIAEYYYLTGKRGMPKKINLPRNLVSLSW